LGGLACHLLSWFCAEKGVTTKVLGNVYQAGRDCLILEGVDGQPAVLAGEALAALLGAAGGVRCVVLNACWSDALAEALLRVVPCVVGMAADLNDRAAIAFAAGFYRMLGLGESVAGAVAGGQAQMLAEGLPATFTGQVRLRTASGVDLSSMRIT
jgi:hypothetical protein